MARKDEKTTLKISVQGDTTQLEKQLQKLSESGVKVNLVSIDSAIKVIKTLTSSLKSLNSALGADSGGLAKRLRDANSAFKPVNTRLGTFNSRLVDVNSALKSFTRNLSKGLPQTVAKTATNAIPTTASNTSSNAVSALPRSGTLNLGPIPEIPKSVQEFIKAGNNPNNPLSPLYKSPLQSQGTILKSFATNLNSVAKPAEKLGGFFDRLRSSIGRVSTGVNNSTKAFKEGQRSLSDYVRFIAKFSIAAGVVFTFVDAIKSLVTGFKSLVEVGFQFNETVELSQVGIASIIASEAILIRNDKTQVKGINAVINSRKIAIKQLDALRVAGLKTTATTQELVTAFQQAIGPGLAAGITNFDTLRDLTVKIVQGAAAIGVPMRQLNEEVRSLLTGAINPINSRLAATLGITGAMVRDWKAQGTLVDNLEKRLAAFGVTGELVLHTMSGIKSNLVEAFQVSSAQAFAGAFEQAKKALEDLTAKIIDVKTGQVQQRILSIGTKIDDVLVNVLEKTGPLIDHLLNGLEAIVNHLGDIASAAKSAAVIFGLVKGLQILSSVGASLLSTLPAIGEAISVMGAGVVASTFALDGLAAGFIALLANPIVAALIAAGGLLTWKIFVKTDVDKGLEDLQTLQNRLERLQKQAGEAGDLSLKPEAAKTVLDQAAKNAIDAENALVAVHKAIRKTEKTIITAGEFSHAIPNPAFLELEKLQSALVATIAGFENLKSAADSALTVHDFVLIIPDLTKGLEAINKAINIKGTKRNALLDLFDSLEKKAEDYIVNASTIKDVTDQVVIGLETANEVLDKLPAARQATIFAGQVEVLKKSLGELKASIGGITSDAQLSNIEKLSKLKDILGTLNLSDIFIDPKNKDAVLEFTKALNYLQGVVQSTSKSVDVGVKGINRSLNYFLRSDIENQVAAINERFTQFRKVLQEAAAAGNDVSDSTKRLASEGLAKLDKAQQEALRKARKQSDDVFTAIIENLTKWKDVARNIFENIRDSFRDIVYNGVTGDINGIADAFKNLGKSVLRNFTNKVADDISKQLFQGIQGALAGTSGGIAGKAITPQSLNTTDLSRAISNLNSTTFVQVDETKKGFSLVNQSLEAVKNANLTLSSDDFTAKQASRQGNAIERGFSAFAQSNVGQKFIGATGELKTIIPNAIKGVFLGQTFANLLNQTTAQRVAGFAGSVGAGAAAGGWIGAIAGGVTNLVSQFFNNKAQEQAAREQENLAKAFFSSQKIPGAISLFSLIKSTNFDPVFAGFKASGLFGPNSMQNIVTFTDAIKNMALAAANAAQNAADASNGLNSVSDGLVHTSSLLDQFNPISQIEDAINSIFHPSSGSILQVLSNIFGGSGPSAPSFTKFLEPATRKFLKDVFNGPQLPEKNQIAKEIFAAVKNIILGTANIKDTQSAGFGVQLIKKFTEQLVGNLNIDVNTILDKSGFSDALGFIFTDISNKLASLGDNLNEQDVTALNDTINQLFSDAQTNITDFVNTMQSMVDGVRNLRVEQVNFALGVNQDINKVISSVPGTEHEILARLTQDRAAALKAFNDAVGGGDAKQILDASDQFRTAIDNLFSFVQSAPQDFFGTEFLQIRQQTLTDLQAIGDAGVSAYDTLISTATDQLTQLVGINNSTSLIAQALVGTAQVPQLASFNRPNTALEVFSGGSGTPSNVSIAPTFSFNVSPSNLSEQDLVDIMIAAVRSGSADLIQSLRSVLQ